MTRSKAQIVKMLRNRPYVYRVFGLVLALIMCIGLIWCLLHGALPMLRFQ